jgi:hypothetical protein
MGINTKQNSILKYLFISFPLFLHAQNNLPIKSIQDFGVQVQNNKNGIGNNNKVNTNIDFYIDLLQQGDKIANIISNMNMWDFHSDWLESAQHQSADYFKKNMPFIKYIHFMQATGGNKERDLFVDPQNYDVKDDYKFDSLITACRNVLKQGLKPYIKTGNVPLKYSTNPVIGESFGVNLNPPDNYEVYYKYIEAIGEALVKEFGKDEVKTWKWGVLTECENKDWFKVDNNSQKTKISYFKLYDYTVAALQKSIGPDVYVGAHSMAVADGFWDEKDFIEHCAKGINYYTGKTGSRICFLSCSFYDQRPGKFMDRSLAETIAIVRNKAKQVGLDNLEYGIDEGRILEGTDIKPLTARIVGETYQAAYDARLFKIILDNRIDYFSSWSYTTSGIWGGVPTVSLHVANLFYKMVGSNRIVVTNDEERKESDPEVDLIAGYNDSNKNLYMMAYNFQNSLEYNKEKNILLNINTAGKFTKKVKITRWIVDNNSNFYGKWMDDCKKFGINDSDFSWSKESTVINENLFTNKKDILYFTSNEAKYKKAAELKPVTSVELINNSLVKIYTKIAANTVVFYQIEPDD